MAIYLRKAVVNGTGIAHDAVEGERATKGDTGMRNPVAESFLGVFHRSRRGRSSMINKPCGHRSDHRLRSTRWLMIAFISLCTGAQAAQAQGMIKPVRMAEGIPGQLLVSDYVAEQIHFVEKQGTENLWSADMRGRPMGIARLGNLVFVGNADTLSVDVYELDTDKHRIKLEYYLGERHRGKKGQGSFKRPTDIAVDAEFGQIFVLDTGDQLVKVFDVSGNFISAFPPAVPGQQVTFVAGVAVDAVRKEVLVSDHGIPYGSFGPTVPARILVFGYTGTYLRQINGNGIVSGTGTLKELQFSRPQGLTTDNVGHIFMVDAVLGELIIFDQNNILDADNVAVVKRLGGIADQTVHLKGPTDVVLDLASGDAYVVNSKLSRIDVFREAGRIP